MWPWQIINGPRTEALIASARGHTRVEPASEGNRSGAAAVADLTD